MPRRIISLNDAYWRVGSVAQKPFGDVNDLSDARDWLPAQVPGDVRLDLLRAGKISDPFFAANNEESQWIDTRDWWYVHDLELKLEKDERAFLVFDGIDYQSAVFFHGKHLGRHAGMFSRQVYEITTRTNFVRDDCHPSLSVRIWGSDALPTMKLNLAQKLWAAAIQPMYRPPEQPFPDRYATVKCQMQFGWDFAPRLRTCGIWDDASIVITRSVFVREARIKSKVKSEKAKVASVHVTLTCDSNREQVVHVVCSVCVKRPYAQAQSFEFDLQLERGAQTREIEFDLADVRLWDPWDRGDPNVYEIEIAVQSQDGEQLDTLTDTFGIRSFELQRVPNAPPEAEPWQFVVNGKREFLRGANWVPMDAIPGRLTRADYAARLQQVRDANINFLRVWGGGLREKRAFYDLCDEMGILVWQEFPFAGAFLDRFPQDQTFLNHVSTECGAIVHVLRNHPSLVVWCGGNEFNTRGNAPIVKTLHAVIESEDGTRPFKPASPYRDELHSWGVWHRSANLRDYQQVQTPFLSEFGLQSLPNMESLKKFLPDTALESLHTLWEYHNAQINKLKRYARGSDGWQVTGGEEEPSQSFSVEMFVEATQRAQAMGLQIAIEHTRRNKPQTVGVAIWQFDDCWPAISWSIVDYYGTPKRAYKELAQLYSPVFASFDYPLVVRRPGDIVHGDLWIINDLRSSYDNAELHVHLNDKEIFSRHVNIEPDSAKKIDALDIPLNQGENVLRLKATFGPIILSDHTYALNYCDVGEINPLGALLVAIGKRLMR